MPAEIEPTQTDHAAHQITEQEQRFHRRLGCTGGRGGLGGRCVEPLVVMTTHHVDNHGQDLLRHRAMCSVHGEGYAAEHGITIEPAPTGGGALAAYTGQPLPLPLPVDGGQVAHRPDAACCVEPVVQECTTGTCGMCVECKAGQQAWNEELTHARKLVEVLGEAEDQLWDGSRAGAALLLMQGEGAHAMHSVVRDDLRQAIEWAGYHVRNAVRLAQAHLTRMEELDANG